MVSAQLSFDWAETDHSAALILGRAITGKQAFV